MTTDDLRAWQKAMGYTYDTAAVALGINRSTYADLLRGVSRTTGKPKEIDRRTELACAAIAAGLNACHTPIGAPQQKKKNTIAQVETEDDA
jgi:transcriptional regulator with XRE-family HTH domain